MNVLFLTLCTFDSIKNKNIYCDLLREFTKNNHNVFIALPIERKYKRSTILIEEPNCKILRIKTGNIIKTNLIEKGISTALIESQFKIAVKKYFSEVKFDLIMYSTPPITFTKVIEYIQKRDNAKSYLLLKDIFPQNAVDLRMFSKRSPIYKLFRSKEKKLYKISDYIGCMSEANVEYVINHNLDVDKEKLHVLPNSIGTSAKIKDVDNITTIREKYGIPLNTRVFIYGGNFGKPQDISFVIDCLKENQNKKNRFFIFCGTGTEYYKLESYMNDCNPTNIKLINGLPEDEYGSLLMSCDVGLIFLDHRFTIPNFPSRLLSYMQNSMPVIACTDTNSDIGKVIVDNSFGWWCESNSVKAFTNLIDLACQDELEQKGKNGRKYFEDNYTVDKSYKIIMENFYENNCE